MSDQNILTFSKKTHLLVVGTCKYDISKLTYVEAFKIAQELAKDSHFLQLLVRRVSQQNWGVQFIFAMKREELPEGMNLWQYFHNTYTILFANTYATDIVVDDMYGELEDNWLVQKPFVIEKE